MAVSKNIIIVESPSKAKSISGYLGAGYVVLPSNGHVRNISARTGAVEPENNFFIHYDIPEKSKKQLDAIEKAIKSNKCKQIYVATDPDREGEAIGWHIVSILKDHGAVGDATIRRISFNEVTRSAVLRALDDSREIDQDLVDAQRARSVLDYLIGFNVSPVLWRKLPGSRSAGRVQSVALRMICDREQEIEQFVPQEYWTIYCNYKTSRDTEFPAQLISIDGKKLDKFDIANDEQSKGILSDIYIKSYKISSIKKQVVSRNPSPPFITSTMQQDASRKLGFSPSRTMRAAQRLYEGVSIGGDTVGLITYMRTDGLYMSDDAVNYIRSYVEGEFGRQYIPANKREYKKKIKNAQEAHEAIRPTDVRRTPQAVSDKLGADESALYEMIWKRAVASQMEAARYDRLTVDIESSDSKYGLRSVGSKLIFDGFLRLMVQDSESSQNIDVAEGDSLVLKDAADKQHFTEPPPRFSEASLIANMEELGIGRPSTYASIINVLYDREYVENKGRVFYATVRGRVVAAFLKNFFTKYVEYDFTADLEDELDSVSNGKIGWLELLKSFWTGFEANVGSVMQKSQGDIMSVLGQHIDYMIPGELLGACEKCNEGTMQLKVSKHGPYLCCSRYPECNYSRTVGKDGSIGGNADGGYPKILGVDPESGKDISVRSGPYGFYIQIGDAEPGVAKPKGRGKKSAEDIASKPKRIPVPKTIAPDSIDLEKALKLAALPMVLGVHPETGEEIKVGSGMFGPYVNYMGIFISINQSYDFLNLTLEGALAIISKSRKLNKGGAKQKAESKKPAVGRFSRKGRAVKSTKAGTT